MRNFLIGTTSWLIPGTYYENAKLVEGKFDFVELLVYTWDKETRKLLEKEIPYLEKLRLFYTVHLPTDEANKAFEAFSFFEKSDIKILNYVLHPLDGLEFFSWGDKISLENLKEKIVPWDRMTFDVGHHLLGKKFPENLKKKIVEIHAMGVEKGKDHLELNDTAMMEMLKYISPATRFICLEVFDYERAIRSLKKIRKVRHREKNN